MIDPDSANRFVAAVAVLVRLRVDIERELRAYPYPITACDTAFKLLSEQREQCRVALLGLAGRDGLSEVDAVPAVQALLETPLVLSPEERRPLQCLADRMARA